MSDIKKSRFQYVEILHILDLGEKTFIWKFY